MTNCIKPNDFKPNGIKPNDHLPIRMLKAKLKSERPSIYTRISQSPINHLMTPHSFDELQKFDLIFKPERRSLVSYVM